MRSGCERRQCQVSYAAKSRLIAASVDRRITVSLTMLLAGRGLTEVRYEMPAVVR